MADIKIPKTKRPNILALAVARPPSPAFAWPLAPAKSSSMAARLKIIFRSNRMRMVAAQPLTVTGTGGQIRRADHRHGGGPNGQAGAVRHGIARALLTVDANLAPALRAEGLLTRDPRMRERKKYGQPGARKRFQYSKR